MKYKKDRLATMVIMTFIASPVLVWIAIASGSKVIGLLSVALLIPITVTIVLGLIYVIYTTFIGS